jgi:hypothetical protein
MEEAPKETKKEEVDPVPAAAPTPAPGLTAEQLASVLSAKQKRKLGLLPPREYTEKEKARLDALRERMRAINNKRKEDKEATMKARKIEAKPVLKRKEPEPDEEPEEEESSDEYIQKKAKKVNKTLHQLSKMDQYMAQLRQQHSHNPFMNLLLR